MNLKKTWKAIKKPFSKAWNRVKTFLENFNPSKTAVRGAALGVLIFAALLLIIPNLLYIKHLGVIVVLIMTILMLAFGILSGLLFNLVLKLLVKISPLLRLALVALFGTVMFTLSLSGKSGLVIYLFLALVSAFAGGALWLVIRKNFRKWNWLRKVIVIKTGIIGFAGLILFTWWIVQPGKILEMPEIAALKGEYLPAHINAEDPGLKGSYQVSFLSYGSGKDKHRKEYGSEVTIITDSVDGSFFVDGWESLGGKLRTKYFGFDLKSLPRNAMVWYPEGNGPFPLVLIVHGNHLAQDFSDPGYDYLGELLASRGFIMASVDENFFNGSYTNIFKGLKTENDARGWMLLEHLKLWREWNKDSTSVFYGKVDMENISLIGHSRGGEAVGHAALFNRLPFYPDNAKVEFDYNFNIRSIIAIAPADGQYQPAGIRTPLRDVSYFVLHGSHDADVQSFIGLRQYERVNFSKGFNGFKSSLYIFNANHGQFNTRWGRKDGSSPRINLFNLRQLLPAEEQQKIAQTYMGAFLEITLRGRMEYIPLFMDYRTGKNWLPETIFLSRFDSPEMQYICRFNEDLDLTTTTVPGGMIESEHLTVWREQMVKLKWGDKETRAAFIGWNRKETDSLIACYSVSIPPGILKTDTGSSLFFSLADANENSNPHPDKKEEAADNQKVKNNVNKTEKENGEEDSDKKKKDEKREAIDFSIVLADVNGETIRFRLSDHAFLQPQLKVKMAKLGFLSSTPGSEHLYQFFHFPLERFLHLNDRFQPGNIVKISLVFDQTEEGVVILDHLGFI